MITAGHCDPRWEATEDERRRAQGILFPDPAPVRALGQKPLQKIQRKRRLPGRDYPRHFAQEGKMNKLKNHVSFYISLKKDTHDFIARLAEKNSRTIAAQVRILLDKMAAKK